MEPDAAPLSHPAELALRTLNDIVLPPPVSWMPQTWGWAAVGLVLAAALALVLARWLSHYRADRYRREALALMDDIEARIRISSSRQQAVQDLAVVLKRVALSAWQRQAVASLSGAAWVRFLDEHAEGEAGCALTTLLDDVEYRDGRTMRRLSSGLADQLFAATRTWIGRHHVSP